MLIWVQWRQYTATSQGHRLKFVTCEGCSAEYVYMLEREATGAGTSVYGLNDQGASSQATSDARQLLSDVLENDFDAVPCPVCGHYQSYMFPKLLGNTGLGVRLILLVVIVLGCLAAANALYRSITYLLQFADGGLGSLVAAWTVLVLLVAVGFGLSFVNSVLISRFNPNTGDPDARIAIGRSRAVTREEYVRVQAEKGPRVPPEVGDGVVDAPPWKAGLRPEAP